MRLTKKQWLLMQIAALLVITGSLFVIRPYLARAIEVNPAVMTGAGQPGMPKMVVTCQDLQDINSDLNDHYQLAGNIDCSDTINWNSGGGFVPIGQHATAFSGQLDGRGYTISGLYIDQAGAGADGYGNTGLFAKAYNAQLLNFSVTGATIIGNSGSTGTYPSTGGIVGSSNGTDLSRLSFGGNISVDCASPLMHVGGIAGRVDFGAGVSTERLSTNGSITVSGPACGQYNLVVGGIFGLGDISELPTSSSTMGITVSGEATSECTVDCRYLGGLIGAVYNPGMAITDSYAAGSISLSGDSGGFLSYAVGGMVGNAPDTISVIDSFSVTELTVPAPCAVEVCGAYIRNSSGILGSDDGQTALYQGNWTGAYFDQTKAGTSSCTNGDSNADGRCNAVNTDGLTPDYFKNNSSVEPLASWDFTNAWLETINYPTLAGAIPNPDAPTNVSATIVSTTQIDVSWTASPGVNGYSIYCKASNQTTYTNCAAYTASTSTSLTGLLPSTQYDIRIVAVANMAYYSNVTPELLATTATPGFILINSCQDLQNINNDLTERYELARDIDCSDSISWNGGAGFDPIGIYDPLTNTMSPFTGIFAGNNYTISNLFCDQSAIAMSNCSLFSATSGALLKDVKITNPQFAASYITGSLVAIANNSEVTNIQVTGAQFSGPLLAVGGIVGAFSVDASAQNDVYLTKSSFNGTMNTTAGTMGGGLFYAGGLIAATFTDGTGTVEVSNNYANFSLTSPAATNSGGLVGFWQSGPAAVVSNNYAAGSINLTSSDPDANPVLLEGYPDNITPIGGLFGSYIAEQDGGNTTIANNFSHMALNSQSPEKFLGGSFGIASLPRTFATNYYDADQAGTTTCSQFNDAGCTAISGQPNYFKNNSTNPPLNTWDFTNIWSVTSEFPQFDPEVTSGITTVSQERLNRGITNGGNTGSTPTPEVSPAADDGTGASVTSSTAGTSASTPSDETGVLGAIKKFVRSLPAGVVVAFPYALFSLLFIAALVLLVELMRELRRIQALQALIAKQRLLAEERDAFWHLAANYLRAPVTLIVGGAEALREANVGDATTAIATLASSLQKKVADIMAKIEGSTSLQAISQVQPRKVTQIARRAIFIVPVVSVATLAILGNYAASSYRNMGPDFIGYVTQLIGFVIATILFYWVLTLLTAGKSKRKAAEELLDRQTNELANARHDLINETAGSLNPDLTKLEGMLHALPAAMVASAPGALSTLGEGTNRLREIVNSFSMLIKVQEGTGAVTTVPEASTVDLANILARTRAKLTPQITAKRVRVSAPAVPLAVHAEADLANQVLESIIANAVDYSPEGGTVKVEAKRLQDAIQVRISDEGQGIDKQQLDHLFQPFVRADGKSAMDMSHGGFGINLYLDKLIMEQLGGSISATSTPGKGTAITMTWPTA